MRVFAGGVLWALLSLSVSAQVGNLTQVAVVDPGPDFTPDNQESADRIEPAISADGRFVFFGSASAGAAEPSAGQTIQSARINPGGAEIVSTISTAPHDGKSVSVSPNGAVMQDFAASASAAGGTTVVTKKIAAVAQRPG